MATWFFLATTLKHLFSNYLKVSNGTIGEGNGNPFQCSFLESPVDRGVWWDVIHQVAQSRTWLK